MPRKKSAAEFFGRGKAKGSENYTEVIDGFIVGKKITNKVSRDHRRMIDLWNQYNPQILLLDIACSPILYLFRYAEDHPGANVSDLLSLKDFMKDVAFSINGAKDDTESERVLLIVT
jgi:hypothetical protein